jgi:hypothetical protein
MKVFTAMIVEERENAPALLLASTEEKLLVKAKEELSWLDGVEDATSLEELSELYDDWAATDGCNSYAGIFTGEQEVE